MITLAQAFKLFGWHKDPTIIYLRHCNNHRTQAQIFWTADLEKYADLRAIKVYHIGEHFTYNDDPNNIELTINYKYETIQKLVTNIQKKKYHI